MEKLAKILSTRGFKVAAIHGNKNQNQRQRALNEFKNGQIKVLLATDVASRGLDIDDVTHVINYDEPGSYEDYIHRIGRTGRAGAAGKAISLICPEDQHHFGIIQKKMGKKVEILESDDINLQGF